VLVGAGSDRRGAGAGNAASKANQLLELTNAGGKIVATAKWQAEKATSSTMSPLPHRGLAYFANQAGVLFALDMETGKEVFNKRLDQSSMATPIGAGERVYFFGRDGLTTVLKADREGTVLAKNTLTLKPDLKPEASQFDGAMGGGKKAEAKGGKQGGGPPGMDKPSVYGVAAVKDRILLRTGSHLYCVGN
jgi:outer membrane protein assembly factor BamB